MSGVRVTVEIKGLREIGERMRTLSADMAGKVAVAATSAGATVIKKRAVQLAPVAQEEVTAHGRDGTKVKVPPGNLKKNIVVRKVPKRQLTMTSEHAVAIRGGRKYGYASNYGSKQEFGTVKMTPSPFLRPAFEQEKENAVAALKKKLIERLDKIGVHK
jgi:HK97 gp10 family phage protein